MIFLRARGHDSNPNGSAGFCGIPVPAGVQDGDLALVGIYATTGTSVSAPDESWTLVASTDPALISGSVWVFQKTALNEQASWVFPLTSTGVPGAIGAALVYGGVDPWQPVEAISIGLTDVLVPSMSQAVGGITASLGGEALALFAGVLDGAAVLTPPSGYVAEVTRVQGALGALQAADRILQSAGKQAPTSLTDSHVATGSATVLVALRPSSATQSVDDVFRRLFDALPPGIDRVLDFTPGGDYDKYFRVYAALLKLCWFDLQDQLRQEARPQKSFYELAKWEDRLGLSTTKVAKLGTVPERQAQVLSSWRAAAGQALTKAAVQGAIAPLAGYADASQLALLNVDRVGLDTQHTYGPPGSLDLTTLPNAAAFLVADSGNVSEGGVRMKLTFDVAPSGLDVTLFGAFPAGYIKHWVIPAAQCAQIMLLYGPEFAGTPISSQGDPWVVLVQGAAPATTMMTQVIVEAVGRDANGYDSLGAAAFEWGVFVDPTKVNGGAGGAVDYDTILAQLRKLQRAHTLVRLIRGSATVSAGQSLAIPDDPNCIPDQVIPA